ncbi:hypothetical protein N665_0033s0006 [Sinapis alba]|nr:hypothetical protein N665_0033s0006 [Sinapis alba]
MATKISNSVALLLSLFLLLLFVSSQVGVAEAKRNYRNMSPHKPPPIYVPSSKSRRGKGT